MLPGVVVLAGGRGTRFWPLSRRSRPKQVIDLTGEGSLLARTLARLDGLVAQYGRIELGGHEGPGLLEEMHGLDGEGAP